MKKSYITRKDSIILAAVKIIDEMGTNGLTIRELANRQGVTEAAIYRHFDSKQDILLAILDKFSYFDEMIKNTIIEQNMDVKDGILFFVKSFAEYYENYPEITSIIFIHDMFRGEPAAAKKLNEILDGRAGFLTNLILRGQEKNEISGRFPGEDLAIIIQGAVKEFTLVWRTHSIKFPLKDRIINTLKILLELC